MRTGPIYALKNSLGPGTKHNLSVKSLLHHIVGDDKSPQTAVYVVVKVAMEWTRVIP